MNIKAVVFDADGVVINSPGYFSVQYQKDFNVSNDVMLPFFKGKFQKCLVGEADLKEELKPLLEEWKWQGSADDLLKYWFEAEHYIDNRVITEIKRLKEKGIKCYLGTKQEKYRMKYIEEDMGLGAFFDGIFSSSNVGYKKPDKRFYNSISRSLEKTEKIKPENILFWDDTKENVDSANECGWNAFLFTNFNDFKRIIDDFFQN